MKKFLRAGTLALLAAAFLWVWVCLPERLRDRQEVLAAAELPAGPFAALTFDDGPRSATTCVLLDGLAQRGVHATFFVIGENVEGNEDLLVRMVQEGHQIGLHTYHHKSLAELNGVDFSTEVNSLRETLTQLLNQPKFMLRPPYGMISEAGKSWAGMPIILWSVDPEDWSDQDTQRQVDLIVSSAQDGDIILLHDIYPSSVETALQVVDALMAKGFHFVTVEELFAIRGMEPEAGVIYRKLPAE